MTFGARMNAEELAEKLKSNFEKDSNLLEVGVGYVPYAHSSEVKLYAPHYGMKGGALKFFQVEESYDYTTYEWYKSTITDGENWIEPYFGKATKTLVAGFAVPFYRSDPSHREPIFAGLVRANFSLQRIQSFMDSLDLGKTGFGVLLSRQGTFIAHPIVEYVNRQKTIFDRAKSMNDRDLKRIGEKALRGESGFLDHVNEVSGQSSWIFYEPIPSTGWSIGVVFIKDEVLAFTHRCDVSWCGLRSSFWRFFCFFPSSSFVRMKAGCIDSGEWS